MIALSREKGRSKLNCFSWLVRDKAWTTPRSDVTFSRPAAGNRCGQRFASDSGTRRECWPQPRQLGARGSSMTSLAETFAWIREDKSHTWKTREVGPALGAPLLPSHSVTASCGVLRGLGPLELYYRDACGRRPLDLLSQLPRSDPAVSRPGERIWQVEAARCSITTDELPIDAADTGGYPSSDRSRKGR